MTAPAVVLLVCPECGAPMTLKPSRYGSFYGCTQWSVTGCRGSHGAHPDGKPMGTPADSATKQARIAAHAAFDRLWQSHGMKRKQAYAWMSAAMQMPSEHAHVSRFDASQCRQLVALIEAYEAKGDK